MRSGIRKPFRWALLAVGGVAAAAALAFLFGLVVMALWNWLMPGIFGLRPIVYWEAWGLVLLAHILFKAGRWGDHRSDRHDRGREEEWKERFRGRFKDRFFGSEAEQPRKEPGEEPPKPSGTPGSPPDTPGSPPDTPGSPPAEAPSTGDTDPV